MCRYRVHLHAPQTLGEVPGAVDHAPAEHRGVLAHDLQALGVQGAQRGVARPGHRYGVM